MPLFNFNKAAVEVAAQGTLLGDVTNTVDGVKFTVSTSGGPGFQKGVVFGNGGGLAVWPLYLTASVSATFTLKFSETATPSKTAFTSSGGTPFALKLGTLGGGGAAHAGDWDITYLNATGGVVNSFTNIVGSESLLGSGATSAIRFKISGAGTISLQHITASDLNCFCEGTLINCPDGERPVEELQAGDVLVTAEGEKTTIKWVGQQHVNTQLLHPTRINPVFISKGALGDKLPERDLLLSQDHAVAIDGTLYNAGALVNGETIYQVSEMPKEGFTYYHIETGEHELLVAEGVAAESFIDYAGRDGFDNADNSIVQTVNEMPLPRVSTARMVPDYLKSRAAA